MPGLVVAAAGLAASGSLATAVPLADAAATEMVVSTFTAEADTRVHEAFPDHELRLENRPAGRWSNLP